MAPSILFETYQKYAPRWFKVIRWRDAAARGIEIQKIYVGIFYLPFITAFFYVFNAYPKMLCLHQPQTEEERLALKRDYVIVSNGQRDWQMGQYNHEVPPVFDVWRRRQKYPQYYGDKYNKFHMDGTW